MKKILAGITAAAMLCATSGVWAAEKITFTISPNGSDITVSGTLPTKNEQTVTLMAYKESTGNSNPDNVAAVVEAKSDAAGKFSITFGMDDDRGADFNTTFVVDVSAPGSEKGSGTFDYLPKTLRDEVFKKLAEISSKSDLADFVNKPEYQDTFASSGMDMAAYNDAATDKNDVIGICYEDADFKTMTETEFIKRFNTALAIAAINDGKGSVSDVLDKLNPSYAGETWAEISADETKTALVNEIKNKMKNGTYGSIADFEDRYAEVAGLYDVNHARSGNITEKLAAAARNLGFENDEVYAEYVDLKSKTAANDALIKKLKNNPADTVAELLGFIEDALDAKEGGGNGGNSGNSGNSGSRPSTGGGDHYEVTDNPKNENGTGFSDTDSVPWAAESIKALVARKVLNGYPDGTFMPNNSITRAEFAKMVVTAMGLGGSDAEVKFEDVANDHWAARYIASATEAGLIKGIDDAHFDPEAMISRQDMAVIIARGVEARNITLTGGSGVALADADTISDYAADSVALLVDGGVISGDENANFNPFANLTRAEAAKVIYYVFQ